MTPTDIAGWAGSALNLVGAYNVTHRNRIGFLIFAGSCFMQLPGLILSHVWSQVALLSAYIVIDVLGYIRWGTATVVTPLRNCYLDCVD
jgi:hypothetical protein